MEYITENIHQAEIYYSSEVMETSELLSVLKGGHITALEIASQCGPIQAFCRTKDIFKIGSNSCAGSFKMVVIIPDVLASNNLHLTQEEAQLYAKEEGLSYARGAVESLMSLPFSEACKDLKIVI